MKNTDLIFGKPGFARFVVTLGYAVSALAGVMLVSAPWFVGVLILLAGIGMVVVGTVKEER